LVRCTPRLGGNQDAELTAASTQERVGVTADAFRTHTFAACPGIPRRVCPGDLGVDQARSSRLFRPSRVNPDVRGVIVTVTGSLCPQIANISSSRAEMSVDSF